MHQLRSVGSEKSLCDSSRWMSLSSRQYSSRGSLLHTAHLMILHDRIELDHSEEGEDFEVLGNFLVGRPEEELLRSRQRLSRGRRRITHLIVLEGRGHGRVQPDCVPSTLAKLLARRGREEGHRHSVRWLILLPPDSRLVNLRRCDDVRLADHLDPAHDVPQLVGSAELDRAVVSLMEG
jgi:hypothetical protein